MSRPDSTLSENPPPRLRNRSCKARKPEVVAFASWNTQGKTLQNFDNWLDLSGEALDFVALQEVGQLHALKAVTDYGDALKQFELQEAHEVHADYVIGISAMDSHLAQMMLLKRDCVEHILGTWRGKRHMCAEFMSAETRRRMVVASCHFPRSNNSDDDFEESSRELVNVTNRYRGIPMIIVGDDKCARGSDRALLLDSCVNTRSGVVYPSGRPTRFGRQSSAELDYVSVNECLNQIILQHSHAVHVRVVDHSSQVLGSDHCCVLAELLLQTPEATAAVKHRRRRRCRRHRCSQWSVDADKVASMVSDMPSFDSTALDAQWESLQRMAVQSSSPMTPLRYKDDEYLKQLCRRKCVCTGPQETACLTRIITATRHEAKTRWLRDLMQRGSSGDSTAIRYLKNRNLARGDAEAFVRNHDGVLGATHALKQHFQKIFAPTPEPTDTAELQSCLVFLQERARDHPSRPLSHDELHAAIARLKTGKVSVLSMLFSIQMSYLWLFMSPMLLYYSKHRLCCSAKISDRSTFWRPFTSSSRGS